MNNMKTITKDLNTTLTVTDCADIVNSVDTEIKRIENNLLNGGFDEDRNRSMEQYLKRLTYLKERIINLVYNG